MKLWLWEDDAMTHAIDAIFSGINRAALEVCRLWHTVNDIEISSS